MSDLSKELEAYILEMQEKYPEKLSDEDKAVKVEMGNRIPGKQDIENKKGKGKEEDAGETANVPAPNIDPKNREAFLHYTSEQTMPYLPLKTINEALEAIKKLEEIESGKREFLVVFLSDSGDRSAWLAKSKRESKRFVEKLYQEYIDELAGTDKLESTYIDEKDGTPNMYEPTPLKYVDENEGMRCKALVDGKVHRFKSDDHYVVYNEITDQTARWDIYDLEKPRKVEDEGIL